MRKCAFEKLGVLISSCGTLRSVDTLKNFMDYLAKLDRLLAVTDLVMLDIKHT